MAVPYTFGTATAAIPLSQLDSNFATAITIGNTAVQLGNTITTLSNVTLTNATITSLANVTLSNATISSLSTPITAAQGGTGLATLTANNVVLGNGTSNVQLVAPGTSGNVLVSTGTTWTSGTANVSSVSGVLPIANGGTGTSSTTYANLTTNVVGTLPVANGGTGLNTTPANGALDIGNGTGFTRATLTAGSGVTITNGAGSITIAASSSSSSYIKNDLSKYDSTLTFSSTLGISFRQYLSVALTATTELVILYGSSSAHAAVWDNANKVFGTPVLIRTATFASGDIAAYGISSSSVLVCSLSSASTNLETVVLSISGTTITVNTPVATTLAVNSTLITGSIPNNGAYKIVLVGSSYVLCYYSTSNNYFRAITVSGTTPTIGAELAVTVTSASVSTAANYAYSSSVLVSISASTTLLYVTPISVSGTTLTAGTQATTTTTASANVSAQLSDNRIAVAYVNSNAYAGVVSVTGTVASISAVDTFIGTPGSAIYMQTFGLQAMIIVSNSTTTNQANVLTNTAGVATVGTALTNPFGLSVNWTLGSCDASKVFIQVNNSNTYSFITVGISSGSPVVIAIYPPHTSNVTGVNYSWGSNTYSPVYGNYENSQMLRTSSYKSSYLPTSSNFLTYSFDGASTTLTQQAVGFGNSGTTIKSPLSNAAGWMVYSNTNTPTVVNVRRIELA